MTHVEKKEFVKNMYIEFTSAVNYHLGNMDVKERASLGVLKEGGTVYGSSFTFDSLYPIPTDQGIQYKEWVIGIKVNNSTLTVDITGRCPMMAYQFLCYGQKIAENVCESLSLVEADYKDVYNVALNGAYGLLNQVKISIPRKELNEDEVAQTAAEIVKSILDTVNKEGIGTFTTVNFVPVQKYAGVKFQ